MTKQQFLYEVPSLIFKEVAKATNQLCGLTKTSSAVVNLFTTLPLKVEVRHIEDMPKPSKKLNALEEFVHAYIKHDDISKVYIAFFYSDEKQLSQIVKRINKHPEFFAYLYMREALKLTRLMNTATHYRMMSNIIKFNAPHISVESHYRYSIAACNYAINNIIADLFKQSRLAGIVTVILDGQQYNPAYSGKSEMDVLIDIIGSNPTMSKPIILDEQFSYDEWSNQVFSMTDFALPTNESIETDLGESLTTQFASISRGTGSTSIFANAFAAKKVKTGWFKKLAAKFSKDVFTMTNQFRSEWSNLKVIYRHKFKSPNTQYMQNKLSVVLSVDHSGSVSTDGLQKLLYLFEKHSKRITKLIVLIHDTEVVQEFELNSDYDIASNVDFKRALGQRFAVGGTSHLDVFRRIDELVSTKQIDPSQSIYISFSDNLSDIPESIKVYPVIKKLSTTFLSPINNPVNIAGTTDITME